LSSGKVAALLKARGWSIRVLLLAAVGVLAAVIYNIWSTLSSMGTFATDRSGMWERTAYRLMLGGIGPYMLPLAMLLICGCFVMIHRPPLGAAGTTLWETPTSRFAEFQGELVGLAVLAGVVALGYAGVAFLGLAFSQSLTDVENMTGGDTIRGIGATILASSAASLCLLGVLLTYWWILGVPQRVTQEVEIPVLGGTPIVVAMKTSADDSSPAIKFEDN
ncbi:MAG: hypothetical protein ABI934_12370, partial [Actinomycetota bacterium]